MCFQQLRHALDMRFFLHRRRLLAKCCYLFRALLALAVESALMVPPCPGEVGEAPTPGQLTRASHSSKRRSAGASPSSALLLKRRCWRLRSPFRSKMGFVNMAGGSNRSRPKTGDRSGVHRDPSCSFGQDLKGCCRCPFTDRPPMSRLICTDRPQ